MLAKFSVKKPLVVIVLIIIIVALGVVSYLNIGMDLLPNMDLPYVVVVTAYPGAAPDVVEKELTDPVESALGGVSGIKSIDSMSYEHFSMVVLELNSSSDTAAVHADIERNLRTVSLPENDFVQEPIILKLDPSMLPIMSVSIGQDGQSTKESLAYLNRVISKIRSVDGVASVNTSGLISNFALISLDTSKAGEMFSKKLVAELGAALGFELKLPQNTKDAIRTELDGLIRQAETDPALQDGDGNIDAGKVLDRIIDYIEGSLPSGGAADILIALAGELRNAGPLRNSLLNSIKTVIENRYILENDNSNIFDDLLDSAVETGFVSYMLTQVGGLTNVLNDELLTQLIFAQDFDMPAGSVQQGAKSFIVKVGDTLGNRSEVLSLPVFTLNVASLFEDYISNISTLLSAIAYVSPDGMTVNTAEITHYSELLSFAAEKPSDFGLWAANAVGKDILTEEKIAELAAHLNADTDFGALVLGYGNTRPVDWRQNVLNLIFTNQIYPASLEGTELTACNAEIFTLKTEFAPKETEIAGIKAAFQNDTVFNNVINMFENRSAEQVENSIFSMIELLGAYGGEGAVTKIRDSGNNITAYIIDFEVISDTLDGIAANSNVTLNLENLGSVVFLDDASKQIATLFTKSQDGGFDSNNSVQIFIEKESGKSSAEISSAINKVLEDEKGTGNGFSYNVLSDDGKSINFMLDTVISSLVFGALIAAFVLLVFLRSVKATLAVSFSIIVSVVSTFVMMYFAGISLNIVSMGGLALGVGMLVDNSIVVLENITRLRAQGKSAFEAAIQGAKQVGGAIFASTVTTMVVFLPIVFIEGLVRQIFWDLALTICFSLLASLLAALTLIPMSYTTILKKTKKKEESKPAIAVKKGYAKALNFSLNNKWVVLVAVITLFAGSLAAAFSLGTELFPDSYMGSITVSYTFNSDRIEEKNAGLSPVNENYYTLEDAYAEAMYEMQSVFERYEDISAAGVSVGGGMQIAGMNVGGSGLQATLTLVEEKKRNMDPHELAEDLETALNAKNPRLYEVSVTMASFSSMFDMGGGVNSYSVYIYGDDYEDMVKNARELSDKLGGIEGVQSVDDGVTSQNDKEYKLIIDKERASVYGLTVGQIYLQIANVLTEPTAIHRLRVAGAEVGMEDVDVIAYSPSYTVKSWYKGKDSEGRDQNVYFINNDDAGKTEYYVENVTDKGIFVKTASGNTKYIAAGASIPLERNGGEFRYSYAKAAELENGQHEVSYVTVKYTVEDWEQQYFARRPDIDLMTLEVSSEDMLGTGAEVRTVPLYKLLSDECFETDGEGNILYRSGGEVLGDKIPLALKLTEGYSTITHVQRQKCITLNVQYGTERKEKDVVADIDAAVTEFDKALPATITATTDGGDTMLDSVFSTLYMILGFGVALIFLVMVAQFQSWKAPFVIMFTIPLAFTGGFFLIAACGLKLSVMALMGLIILMGVVVNNGIVFVDYARQLIKTGVDRRTALIRTGIDRMRPIFMTALTTVCAMIIMAADGSDYGLMLQPLAIACIGGLLYATLVTLFVIPVLFDIFFRKKDKSESMKAFREEQLAEVDPENIFDEVNPVIGEYISGITSGSQFRIIAFKKRKAESDTDSGNDGLKNEIITDVKKLKKRKKHDKWDKQ